MNYWNVSVFCNVKETHRAQPVAQQLYRLHSANQRRQHIGELVSRWNLFHCHQVTLNMDFYICQPQIHTHTHFKQIHFWSFIPCSRQDFCALFINESIQEMQMFKLQNTVWKRGFRVNIATHHHCLSLF